MSIYERGIYMNRLFKRSNYARYFNLDKMWDFVLDPEDCGKSNQWYIKFPENAEKMPVPSCWNMTLGKFRYMGVAWYRTDFEINSDSIYLKFEGVANYCDVYIDGKHIGSHYGPFVEFGFVAEGIGSGCHQLVVRVDNSLNYTDTVPHASPDWYNYGGINRSVEVREIGDVWISDYRIDYELDLADNSVVLDVSAHVVTKGNVCGQFKVYVNDECVYTEDKEAGDKAKLVASDIKLENVNLWDIYKPNLYYIRIEFAGDDIIDRTGFRKIETSGKDILLNGRKILLTGVCRHEEHPDWGFSMPFELIRRDIDIIRNMNCNAIRGSHYPNSKKTLDYCDQVGMLFWEEIPMWGFCPGQMPGYNPDTVLNATLTQRMLSMHTEMVKRDINHPSIIFWGLHNEIGTDEQWAYELSSMIADTIKALDTTRLVTYASNKTPLEGKQDICFGLVDVISVNYYTSWYSDSKNENFAQFVERIRNTLKGSKNENKPFIMSEFGGGAIKGNTSFEAQRWTENYQAALLDDAINSYLGSGEVCGTYIWQYCDIRTTESKALSRPREFNNKGILDEYRRPKYSYETVKKTYAKYNANSNNETKITLY